MSKLQEKTVTIAFNIAGYDLEDLDYTAMHNALMLKATEELAMFAVVGGFESHIEGQS